MSVTSSELDFLKDISHKLDQLIILTKLSNREIIAKYKTRIEGDKVYAGIMNFSDGSLTYSDICKKVSVELNVAEITVKKKVAELKEMGFLVSERRGKQVYYLQSGLFE